MPKLSLKEWRRAKGFSLKYMSEKLGIHVNTYIKWEEKPSEIKLSKALEISNILGVSMDDIIFLP